MPSVVQMFWSGLLEFRTKGLPILNANRRSGSGWSVHTTRVYIVCGDRIGQRNYVVLELVDGGISVCGMGLHTWQQRAASSRGAHRAISAPAVGNSN